jgi:hypothetical protein
MAGNSRRCSAFAANMNVRLAKIAHQALVRFEVDLLIAEENDAVRNDGVMHFFNLAIRERSSEIDIADLGADMGVQGVTVTVS